METPVVQKTEGLDDILRKPIKRYEGLLSDEDWAIQEDVEIEKGRKLLKRKLLGLCGGETYKTREEVQEFLEKNYQATSDEINTIISHLLDGGIAYDDGQRVIKAQAVRDRERTKSSYRIYLDFPPEKRSGVPMDDLE